MDRLERGGDSIEELWTTMKNIIYEVAMETIGERPKTPHGHMYLSDQAKLLSINANLGQTFKLHMIQTQPQC